MPTNPNFDLSSLAQSAVGGGFRTPGAGGWGPGAGFSAESLGRGYSYRPDGSIQMSPWQGSTMPGAPGRVTSLLQRSFNRLGGTGTPITSLMPGAMTRDVNALQQAEGARAGAVQGQLGAMEGLFGQTQDLYSSLSNPQGNPLDQRITAGDTLAQQQLTDFDRLAYGEGGILPTYEDRSAEDASSTARGISRQFEQMDAENKMAFDWQNQTGGQQNANKQALDFARGEQTQMAMTEHFSRANEARASLATSLAQIRAGIQGGVLDMHKVGSSLAQFKTSLQQGLLATMMQGRSDMVGLVQEGIENPVSWFAALSALWNVGVTPGANRAQINLPQQA